MNFTNEENSYLNDNLCSNFLHICNNVYLFLQPQFDEMNSRINQLCSEVIDLADRFNTVKLKR